MNDIPDLAELLARPGTDKQTVHSYGRWYHDWLAPLRGRAGARLLEIGVSDYGGGQLLAFAEFLPHAHIVGVDITLEGLLPEVRTHRRITLDQADVYNDLRPVLSEGSFDVIIDDCLHDPDRQRWLFGELWCRVNPGGLYVIEDVAASYLASVAIDILEWLGDAAEVTPLDLRRERPEVPDNCLIAVRKTC